MAAAYDPNVEPSAPIIADTTSNAAVPLISLPYKVLKDKCAERNLDTSGGKEDLIKRLVKAETSPAPVPAPAPTAVRRWLYRD